VAGDGIAVTADPEMVIGGTRAAPDSGDLFSDAVHRICVSARNTKAFCSRDANSQISLESSTSISYTASRAIEYATIPPFAVNALRICID
jgi:hypothetical protein